MIRVVAVALGCAVLLASEAAAIVAVRRPGRSPERDRLLLRASRGMAAHPVAFYAVPVVLLLAAGVQQAVSAATRGDAVQRVLAGVLLMMYLGAALTLPAVRRLSQTSGPGGTG